MERSKKDWEDSRTEELSRNSSGVSCQDTEEDELRNLERPSMIMSPNIFVSLNACFFLSLSIAFCSLHVGFEA